MARTEQSGFSLIEILLVFAISGALIAIAFTGQDEIRQRTEFDSGVNQLVATVAAAKNDSTSGVNFFDSGANVGQGKGGTCPGGTPGNPNVFAGTVWSAASVGGMAVVTIDYFKAETDNIPGKHDLDGIACRFLSTTVPVPYQINVAAPGGRIIFARNDIGNLVVCQITNMSAGQYPGNAEAVFGKPATPPCVQPAPLALQFTDLYGHTADVKIDDSGLARRIN